jgi:hypothetical protein
VLSRVPAAPKRGGGADHAGVYSCSRPSRLTRPSGCLSRDCQSGLGRRERAGPDRCPGPDRLVAHVRCRTCCRTQAAAAVHQTPMPLGQRQDRRVHKGSLARPCDAVSAVCLRLLEVPWCFRTAESVFFYAASRCFRYAIRISHGRRGTRLLCENPLEKLDVPRNVVHRLPSARIHSAVDAFLLQCGEVGFRSGVVCRAQRRPRCRGCGASPLAR